ncbi:FKBP-type peptidyl-prolyl cis-trans isomerase, partial [Balneolaceae bacterium ANBcel3]|nr:FKBP-type peptidyl-prolyl cis-trans isomerase [Balneolaceae bacterium ANBcel3]
ESGLQYKIIEEGEGEKPVVGDTVRVQYRGKLVSGLAFHNSYSGNRSNEFIVDERFILSGFKEGLLLMPVGSRYELVLPSELAYGENEVPSFYIHSGATIILDVRLLEIL